MTVVIRTLLVDKIFHLNLQDSGCVGKMILLKVYYVLFDNPAVLYFLFYFVQTLGVNVFSVFSCVLTHGSVLVFWFFFLFFFFFF